MLTSKNYKLTREKTGVFLQGLANKKEDALTVFLPSGMTTDEVAAFSAENTENRINSLRCREAGGDFSHRFGAILGNITEIDYFTAVSQLEKSMLPAVMKRSRCFP